ncbi:hypothetical protein KIW84_076686 [Lathyrus oleraceus]|nr:hypothetical protein KIW84_076686 [Pisum sativum]
MDLQDTDDVSQVIRVEEKWIAGYECPEFILSELEERCIAKPWEQGVIIKMLKRSIGYRALENRLQVMWAKWGFLNIIDLGQEFYLVTFTNQEDQALALLEGSWLILDHYLTVREWSLNFWPSKDYANQLAMWVRLLGLPIEYYDIKC